MTFSYKEIPADSGIDMFPGEDLSRQALAQIPGGINLSFDKGFHPDVVAKVLSPTIETTALFDRLLKDRTQATVSTGEDSFEKRKLGVMPFEAQAFLF